TFRFCGSWLPCLPAGFQTARKPRAGFVYLPDCPSYTYLTHFLKFAGFILIIPTPLLRFNDSTIQRFNDSTIQRFNDSTIQRFNDSTIQRFNDSTMPPAPDVPTTSDAHPETAAPPL